MLTSAGAAPPPLSAPFAAPFAAKVDGSRTGRKFEPPALSTEIMIHFIHAMLR